MYWDYRITAVYFVWVFFLFWFIFACFLNENRLITSMKDKKNWKINDKYCLQLILYTLIIQRNY